MLTTLRKIIVKIRKAVIPVAGKGTRFLPATKEQPKEMIPILDRPIIHYVVQEIIEAGIEQIVLVTSSGKETIENYFGRNLELETFLRKNHKHEYADMIKDIGSMIEVVTVRQKEQLGLGHAVLCAETVVGQDDFAVLLGDEIMLSSTESVIRQLIRAYEKHDHASIIGVMEVNKEETHLYGIVDGDYQKGTSPLRIRGMVEKPTPDEAPTNLANPGRYVFTKEIFSCLKRIGKGVGGEYQLTDAVNLLAQESEVYAHKFDGTRYDVGNIKGYLKATVDMALAREETGEFMRGLMGHKAGTP